VLLVTLAFICGLGAVGAIPSIRGLKPPIPTATIPSPRPNATLGGTLGDFTQRYGNSIDESGQVYTTTLAGQRVLIVVQLDSSRQSRDGREHIIALAVQVPGDALGVETWDVATADVIATTFLPADAQYQRIVTLYGEMHYVYHSDALARTFLPGQYTNVSGSLNYFCHAWPPTPSARGYGQCNIILGTGTGADVERHITERIER
jgi:hypothetical protein